LLLFAAAFAHQQFLLLVFDVIGSVKDSQVIDPVGKLYALAGDAVFLALAAEDALTVIPPYNPDLLLPSHQ